MLRISKMSDIISLEIVHTGTQVGKLIIIKLQLDKQTESMKLANHYSIFFTNKSMLN